MDERDLLMKEMTDLLLALSSNQSSIGDWKIIKYQEYVDAGKEAPYDITELNTKRQAARDRIEEIKKELEALGETVEV